VWGFGIAGPTVHYGRMDSKWVQITALVLLAVAAIWIIALAIL
jgi:hypothetical protein